MEGKIIITSDSTCDLSPALLEENHISLARLSVILGDTTYRDGEGIEPQTIFDFVEKTAICRKRPRPAWKIICTFSDRSQIREIRSYILIFPPKRRVRTGSPWRRKRR